MHFRNQFLFGKELPLDVALDFGEDRLRDGRRVLLRPGLDDRRDRQALDGHAEGELIASVSRGWMTMSGKKDGCSAPLGEVAA